MMNEIIRLLGENKKIEDWKIHETNTRSEELFFIQRELDMNRSKNVCYYELTVYVEIQEEGCVYTGFSTVHLHPTMSSAEIKIAIDKLVFSASVAKNKRFKIVSGNKQTIQAEKKMIEEAQLSQTAMNIANQIFTVSENGSKINSTEIFVNQVYHHIINSKGVDVSFITHENLVEMVTEGSGVEEIELYEVYFFTDEYGMGIAELIQEQLEVTKYRAIAKEMPKLSQLPILVKARQLRELFGYYLSKSNAQAIYEKLSNYQIGESIQGGIVKGDTLNITMNPFLDNSTLRAKVDSDGVILEKHPLIQDGKLVCYRGTNQFSSYIDVPITGKIMNFEVSGGSISYLEMIKQPHVELLSFSNFQADALAGEFGGEIRLAKYFDGENIYYFTGGSLSANINEVHDHMFLSTEIQQINEYKGPKAMMFVGDIAGKE